MERAWFYEILFIEVVMVNDKNAMVKDEKKYSIEDTTSEKFSFLHYVKWTRVMLPVVVEEFELVCIFSLFFLFTIVVDW